MRVEVSGHTDNVTAAAYNRKLSEVRAGGEEALTERYGMAAERVTPKGYADTKPPASNGREEGRAENRRVELTKLP